MTLIQHLQVPTFEYNMLRKMFGCAESKIITETVSDNEQFKVSQGHSLLSMTQVWDFHTKTHYLAGSS